MASFVATPHPVLAAPTPADALALGEARWRALMGKREEIIAAERLEPFDNLWEPPIWKLCDCLLGFPWIEPAFAALVRQRLGFAKRVSTLLINGAQRGGKTQYSCSRVMKVLRWKNGRRAWMLHENLDMSREYHQAQLYAYLPAHLRNEAVREKTAYIAYKQQTGFGPGGFTLPAPEGEAGSSCTFKAYEQDMNSVQGGNLDIIAPDELVPIDWVNEMRYRIAERDGWMIITFTPVQGYSETVREFQDGAVTALEVPAYLLPADGGEPDLARQLGLTDAELKELYAAEECRPPRAAYYPQSRPDPLAAILADSQEPIANSQAESRAFEMVPRVLRCVDPERAVVFFHLGDNPYGNPKSVWKNMRKTRGAILERAYGVAVKNVTARFAKFRREVHVVPASSIPKEGSNYVFVDPCDGRNFFIKWYRSLPGRRSFQYREWPGTYPIPGVGIPGPWAMPDGKKPDGRRGPAQTPFGFGLRRYKLELARLEGWKDYLAVNPDDLATLTKPEWEEWVDALDPANGAREEIRERFIDSRFASTPKVAKDRPVTLITEFEEIGVFFTPTPGDDIEEGCTMIDDALDFDADQPVSYMNQPRHQISSDCENSIFAMLTWTGLTKDGRRDLDGATKDPIDDDRYFFLSDCGYLGGQVTVEDEERSEFEQVQVRPGARRHY